MPDPISDPKRLPSAWRSRAANLREWGAPEATARVWEKAAAEVEQVLRRWDRTTLTLREAARESGYSADHLGALVREGEIPNAGRKGAPRIRRADLPVKAPSSSPEGRPSEKEDPDVTSIADALR